MTRRTLFTLAAMPLFAFDRDDDKHKNKHGNKDDDDRDGGGPRGGGYFRQEDAAYLRQHYSGPSDLPPGLRKKYYRTGTLPPGWEKRFRPFPPVVAQRLPPPPPNCERGYIDGFAVVYDRRTRVIVDILDIVNAVRGR